MTTVQFGGGFVSPKIATHVQKSAKPSGGGPGLVLQGQAMAYGMQGAFFAFAIACAFLPAVWEHYVQRSHSCAATSA